MSSLLRIDSSPRGEESHSRALADAVQQSLVANDPALDVQIRDLANDDLPALSAKTITGFYTPKGELSADLQEATLLSDTLIQELKAVDTVLISAPMYNFGVPSSLKAWIDQIVRVNETFSFDETGFCGLVTGKRVILALSYGAQGYGENEAFAAMNFFEPYLVSLLKFLGFEDVLVFRLEGTSMLEPDALSQAKQAVLAEISATLEAK
ncbi:MAG: FMN-dependent NADH-azoreductase [Pontibacterium sp.]